MEVVVDTGQMIDMEAAAVVVAAALAVEYTQRAAFHHDTRPDRHATQWTIALAVAAEIWAVATIQKIGIPMHDPIDIQIRTEDIIRQR